MLNSNLISNLIVLCSTNHVFNFCNSRYEFSPGWKIAYRTIMAIAETISKVEEKIDVQKRFRINNRGDVIEIRID